MGRYAEVTRKTGETDIVVKLDLDGCGVRRYLDGRTVFRPYAQRLWSPWPVRI